MMIAPSNSGKTYFAENILVPFLQSHNVKNKYFSSDAIRRQLLADEDRHKHGTKMMGVSKQAFQLLEAGVDAYTSFPVNTDVVIVDATNLTKTGRAKIIEIAKENHYSLVGLLFDYADKSDYFKYLDESTNKKIISDSIFRLRDTTVKELERADFERIYKIDSIDFSNIQLSYEAQNNYAVVNYDRACIIGDPHGCLDELIEVLLDNKGIAYDKATNRLSIVDEEKYTHHIIIGDFIDKGPQIREIVEFLHLNKEFFMFVKGNHENWVYLYLKKVLKPNASNDELIANWFDSVTLFEADEELKQKFFELHDLCKDFILSDNFICTHAPVKNKYLGKSDSVSVKKQRTMMYPKRKDFETEEEYLDAKEQAFRFLEEDASHNAPYHIFGHTPVPIVYKNKNKVCIDTGCVMGNYLSTITFTKKARDPFIKKYASKQPKSEEPITPYFRTKENSVDLSSLDIDLRNRLKFAALNKLNFIAGTMSPADKLDNDLESLQAGLEYYKSKGITKVVLQPKFMGSRCQMWLTKNGDDNKMYSRNGFEIRHSRINISEEQLKSFYKALQSKFAYVFEYLSAEAILFDGELLPWVIMGEQMIEKEFRLQSKALTTELELLEGSGFYENFNSFVTKENITDAEKIVITEYNKLVFNISKSDSAEKVAKFKKEMEVLLEGYDKKRIKLLAIQQEANTEIAQPDQVKEDLKAYLHQLELFGQPGEPQYQPFSILKFKKVDGSEENYVNGKNSNEEIFRVISDQPYAVLELEGFGAIHRSPEEPYLPAPYHVVAEKFWAMITRHREMEGIVIKPLQAYVPGVAPYMKVRNPEYLRMTYGMDYKSLQHKHEKLLHGKYIKNKLATSIKEWELGRRMLDIPNDEIALTNPLWLTLAIQLISEQESEGALDPRL